jgi:hypothetical protein
VYAPSAGSAPQDPAGRTLPAEHEHTGSNSTYQTGLELQWNLQSNLENMLFVVDQAAMSAE